MTDGDVNNNNTITFDDLVNMSADRIVEQNRRIKELEEGIEAFFKNLDYNRLVDLIKSPQ